MLFNHLPKNSRVWVYTANRDLTEKEVSFLNEKTAVFIQQWAAHGNELAGDFTIHKNRFIILVVDETKIGASGCSIDTSVNFIKDLGSIINVDFFDRINMVVTQGEQQAYVHMFELENYGDWKVYNPMVSTLKELRENWLIPISESPFV